MSMRQPHHLLLSLCFGVLLLGSLGCLVMDSYDGSQDEETPEVNNANNATPEPDSNPDTEPKPNPNPNEGFIVAGYIDGDAVPAGTKVVALWSVTTTSPAYFYLLGQGQASGAGFRITLPMDELPQLALNTGGLGVAMLVALPQEATLPQEGSLTRDEFRALTNQAIGISKRHAVIYRQRGGQPSSAWSLDFSQGYQCGVGVEASANQSAETFKPVSCAEVAISPDGQLDWVNWR